MSIGEKVVSISNQSPEETLWLDFAAHFALLSLYIDQFGNVVRHNVIFYFILKGVTYGRIRLARRAIFQPVC